MNDFIKTLLLKARGVPQVDAMLSGEASREVSIKKSDAELQIVWGEVYAPGPIPDSQGDFASEETVRNAAYGFMQKSAMANIDTNHTRINNGSYVVESFIARKGDPDFIPGSWVIGVHVPDPTVWGKVKSGELNGFSLDGLGIRVPTQIEIEYPDMLKGETDEVSGHKHGFIVKWDEETGDFLGGVTTEAEDGHFHEILKGTVTEEANGHNHRFSFVEGVLNVQTVN